MRWGTLVEGVRRFNRTVTQRIGVLNDAYLSRNRPLGQARVLWEIGEAGGEVRALRERLDLDSGYLSRLLRALEADGLVEVEADGSDARVRTARLTASGRAERAYLNQASDDLAAEILAPLDPEQRERLVTAMADVERLLTASQVEIAVTDPPLPHHVLRGDRGTLRERLRPRPRRLRARRRTDDARRHAARRHPARRPRRLRRPQVRPRRHGHCTYQAHVGGPECARPGPRPQAARGARGAGGTSRRTRRPPGHQQGPGRGDRHVSGRGLPRSRRLQRRDLRPPLVRKATVMR